MSKFDYQPMQLLKELFAMEQSDAPLLKKAAQSVYHRDYLRTKKKKYRKYNPEDAAPQAGASK